MTHPRLITTLAIIAGCDGWERGFDPPCYASSLGRKPQRRASCDAITTHRYRAEQDEQGHVEFPIDDGCSWLLLK